MEENKSPEQANVSPAPSESSLVGEGKRFKTLEDLEKSYRNAEIAITQREQENKQLRDENGQASGILNAVANDPDLTKQVRVRLGLEQPEPPKKKTEEPTMEEVVSQQVAKATMPTRGVLTDKLIGEFEDKFGIASLPQDKQKEVKGRIGDALARFGLSVSTIPPDKLPKLLEDAYYLSNMDELKKQGKTEALAEMQKQAQAEIGIVPASSQKSDESNFNPEEEKILKKLGITESKDIEDAKKIKQELEKES